MRPEDFSSRGLLVIRGCAEESKCAGNKIFKLNCSNPVKLYFALSNVSNLFIFIELSDQKVGGVGKGYDEERDEVVPLLMSTSSF